MYLAREPAMDRKFAIKVLNDPDKLKYFELKKVVSGKLLQRNIVTIHDYVTDASLHEMQSLTRVICL